MRSLKTLVRSWWILLKREWSVGDDVGVARRETGRAMSRIADDAGAGAGFGEEEVVVEDARWSFFNAMLMGGYKASRIFEREGCCGGSGRRRRA